MASSANLTITPSLVVVLLNPHQTLDPPTHRCSAWIVFIAMLDGFLGVACHRLSGPGPHGWKWHGQSCNHLANVARWCNLHLFFCMRDFIFWQWLLQFSLLIKFQSIRMVLAWVSSVALIVHSRRGGIDAPVPVRPRLHVIQYKNKLYKK